MPTVVPMCEISESDDFYDGIALQKSRVNDLTLYSGTYDDYARRLCVAFGGRLRRLTLRVPHFVDIERESLGSRRSAPTLRSDFRVAGVVYYRR